MLDLDPEPEPPASAAASCFACNGCRVQWYHGGYALPCEMCVGAGTAPLISQAAALVAAAGGPELCDHCGGPLDEVAETDDALQMVCGACVEADRAATLAA